MSDAEYTDQGVLGSAGFSSVASHSLQGTYIGVGAHAGASPWEGVNALDALVSAYVNVSLLRQQIRPTERIHGAIVEAPKVNGNAIPARTKIEYTVRSTTIKGARALGDKVRLCVEAGAVATSCDVEVEDMSGYADLRVNETLCGSFQKQMQANGVKVLKRQGYVAAATDQGNVSYVVPALHAIVGISVDDGSKNHTPGFTKAAGSATAYERAVVSGRAMSMTGWEILTDDALFAKVKRDFEDDRRLQ